MAEKRKYRCRVDCQRDKRIEAEVSAETGIYEGNGIRIELTEKSMEAGRLGEIRLDMRSECNWEDSHLRMEKPIRVYLPVEEKPEKITAMYMFNPWWTRPAFVDRFQDIPDLTQVAFFKYHDRFACFLPMVGREFKSYLVSGTEDELCLEMTAYLGGQREVDELLYLWTEAATLAEAVHTAFTWLADYKGIRTREKRRIPEMFRYLGWCSWDAFYKKVSEEKIRQKAEELTEKKVPVNWMIIDDGWLSSQGELICDFAPDKEKFPNGFRDMAKEIKENGDIRWIGVWHALGGYWGGVLPESELAQRERPYLHMGSNGKLVPSPQTGEGFYRDWYRKLSNDGIDFVKVDGQSAVPFYFENSIPVSEAARGMNQALESGASYMDGAIINCMGMAMESILARPVSAVSRNSDDFVPARENGFAEHLLQNAYNAVYHNELYCCDWDMFWTKHEDCVKHSLLRAISGGPVYFSDRIGDTVPEVLKPLTYQDGRILMMDRSAKPTQDCMFSNPMEDGVLKLHNVGAWGECGKGGGIAAYNLTNQRQPYAFRPMDIPDIEMSEQYWVYDFFGKKGFVLNRNESYEGTLEEGGFAWFVILPKRKSGSCLGLLNKYAGFMAVESIQESDDAQTIVIRESGLVGWISERKPRKVMAGAADVTEKVQTEGQVYSVLLPETSSRTVLSVIW